MHTLLESKSIFAIEQKAIVACFVKNVAFLLGHLVIQQGKIIFFCVNDSLASIQENYTAL